MHASVVLTSASLVALSAAMAWDPFTLNIPKAIGLDDMQTSTALCDSFDPKDRSKVSQWPVGGHAVAVTTSHEYAVWKYSVALADSLSNWIPLIGEIEQAGVGSFCIENLPVSQNWIGKDALLRVEQHTSHAGVFYQCAAITFVEGLDSAVPHGCFNDSDIALARLPAKRAAEVQGREAYYPRSKAPRSMDYSQQIQGVEIHNVEYPESIAGAYTQHIQQYSATPSEAASAEPASSETASADAVSTDAPTTTEAPSYSAPAASSSSSASASEDSGALPGLAGSVTGEAPSYSAPAASSSEESSASAMPGLAGSITGEGESSTADAEPASATDATGSLTLTFTLSTAASSSAAEPSSATSDADAISGSETTSTADASASDVEPAETDEPTSTPEASASDVEPAETDEPTSAASSTADSAASSADAVSAGASSSAPEPTVTAGAHVVAKAPSALVVGVLVGALIA